MVQRQTPIAPDPTNTYDNRSIPNNPTIEVDIHAAVDKLLFEQGSYSPVEFLLQTGLLRYTDYEAWRHGQVAMLEQRLPDNAKCIRGLLEQASQYAQALGLESETRVYLSLEHNQEKMTLACCTDAQGQQLYCTHFVPCPDRFQTDLFLDNPETVLINGLKAALTSWNEKEADRLLKLLQHQQPEHPLRKNLKLLYEAQLQTELPIKNAVDELAKLRNDLQPLATQILSTHARDYLYPMWQRLARALTGTPFNPARPDLHLSFIATQQHDWEAVRNAVESEDNWQKHALLHIRRAFALERMGELEKALASWFQLCWKFPQETTVALDGDKSCDVAWSDFRALDPCLETQIYPAWRLLVQPELIHKLSHDLAPPETTAGKVLRLVVELQNHSTAHSEAPHADIVASRKALKETHEPLFIHYMQMQL